MTTIAWDGKSLAADRMVSDEGGVGARAKKIWIKSVKGEKTIIAICGRIHAGLELIKWVQEGRQPDYYPDIDDGKLILVSASKLYEFSFGFAQPIEYSHAQRIAWGSGGPIGLGAMGAGATATEAVRIACKYDTGSGNGVDSFCLDDIREPKKASVKAVKAAKKDSGKGEGDTARLDKK